MKVPGVIYARNADGGLDITLTGDGCRRFLDYPFHIRMEAHAAFVDGPTVAEMHKLTVARSIAWKVYLAVAEDLMCERASKRFATEAQRVRDNRKALEALFRPGYKRKRGEPVM